MSFETATEETLILVRVTDPWSIDELMAFHSDLLADTSLETAPYVLMEWGRARALTVAEIDQWVNCLSTMRHLRPVRQAIVVSSDLQYGMGRIAQARMEFRGVPLMVFRDVDAAKAWLVAA